MIYESVDGLYYSRPGWSRPGYNVVSDAVDGLILQIAKSCRLRPGIALKRLEIVADIAIHGNGQAIIMGNNAESFLEDVNLYKLTLRKPIPKAQFKDGTFYGPEPPFTIWSIKVNVNDILDAMQVKESLAHPLIIQFLGENYKRRLRDQIPFLVGAKITPINYASYLRQLVAKYGSQITLKRKEAFIRDS